MNIESFEAGIEYEGERLDKYLSLIFQETNAAQSRSFFQKIIKDGHVRVNDVPQKANYRLKADDIILVEIPDAVETPILPEDIRHWHFFLLRVSSLCSLAGSERNPNDICLGWPMPSRRLRHCHGMRSRGCGFGLPRVVP